MASIFGTALGAGNASATSFKTNNLDVTELQGDARENAVQKAQDTTAFRKYEDSFEQESAVKNSRYKRRLNWLSGSRMIE